MRLFLTSRKLFGQQDHHFVPLQPSHAGVVRDGGIDLANPAQFDRTPLWAALVVVLGAAVILLAPRHDVEKADLAQLQQQATQGEPKAMLQLAIDYRDGLLGLSKNAVQSDRWLAKAEQAGDAEAAALLGDAYSQGLGVKRDPEAAQRLWREAAAAGNVHAETELGQPTTEDATAVTLSDQSFENLQQRAQSGDSVAEYQLALRYRDGSWGVNANPQLALGWLQMAANHGNPVAMATLADAYDKGGFGLTADPTQSRLWHQRADAASQAGTEVTNHG